MVPLSLSLGAHACRAAHWPTTGLRALGRSPRCRGAIWAREWRAGVRSGAGTMDAHPCDAGDDARAIEDLVHHGNVPRLRPRVDDPALERGDRGAATARDPATLDDLVAEHGDDLLPLALDVTDREAAFAAIRQAHERFDRLDVVVNNAGYGQF